MPIYEYRCEACGHEMEALQKISDNVLIDCPACEQPALKKLVSAAGFRLSGSGWYETDFKSGKQKNLSGDKAAPATSKEDASGNSDKASASKSKDSAN
jgi:putative FmdB family regulatory protein